MRTGGRNECSSEKIEIDRLIYIWLRERKEFAEFWGENKDESFYYTLPGSNHLGNPVVMIRNLIEKDINEMRKIINIIRTDKMLK